jgi:hypothetical protein
VADQFERMRSVFRTLFPKLQIDPGTPIIVLAMKDEKDFRFTLKGKLNPCADLEGRPAKVEYVDSASKGATVVAIEIHK